PLSRDGFVAPVSGKPRTPFERRGSAVFFFFAFRAAERVSDRVPSRGIPHLGTRSANVRSLSGREAARPAGGGAGTMDVDPYRPACRPRVRARELAWAPFGSPFEVRGGDSSAEKRIPQRL